MAGKNVYQIPVSSSGVPLETLLNQKVDKNGYQTLARVEDIGTMGALGACVGVCTRPPSGVEEYQGTRYKSSDDYGNYIHTASGSVLVYIPLHFVKRLVNVVTIKSIYDLYPTTSFPASDRTQLPFGYANLAAFPVTGEAGYVYKANDTLKYYKWVTDAYVLTTADTNRNAALAEVAAEIGYFLPRAFIDGGVIQDGFFADKYPKNSVQNAMMVSKRGLIPLTSSGAITGYGFANCTANSQTPVNNYGGILSASKSRGANYYPRTVFHDFCIATLTQAHRQASTGTTYCAYNDVSPYYPKGNNNNALKDTNDASVTFKSAGNKDYFQRSLTGSGTPFAKTTHNGQNCGIADVQGNVYHILIGLTAGAGNELYTLKESVVFKDLIDSATASTTNGAFSYSATDTYESIGVNPCSFPQIGGTAGWRYFGNSTNQVFSDSTDRTTVEYKIAACGLPLTTGYGATGTAEYGNDGIYVPSTFPSQLCIIGSGHWLYGSVNGVWLRYLNLARSETSYNIGGGLCLSHVNS